MAAILVFSKTAGYRHESIPAGVAAITELAGSAGLGVEATEDAGVFGGAGLAPFAAVVWLSTSGDVLDSGQRSAFERYIGAGGGFAGVHGAADTGYSWPWYGRLVGAYFQYHPEIQPATVRVVDHGHPSTAGLPRAWHRTDEWYSFRSDPRPGVRVLATLDESSYDAGPGAMGSIPSSGATNRARGGPGTPRSATPSSPTPSRCSATTCSAESVMQPKERDHEPTDHPVYRSVGGPAVRGGVQARRAVGLRRAGDRLLGRPLRGGPRAGR